MLETNGGLAHCRARCAEQDVDATLEGIGAVEAELQQCLGPTCMLYAFIVQGVDEAYDAALEGIDAVEAELQRYLGEARRCVGGGVKVAYVSLNKESHVLEVPEVRLVTPAFPVFDYAV